MISNDFDNRNAMPWCDACQSYHHGLGLSPCAAAHVAALTERVEKLEQWSREVSETMDAELTKIYAKLAELPIKQAE